MRIRILSPRWDDASQRWQQPGEEFEIRDSQWEAEAACYVHHAVQIAPSRVARASVPEPVPVVPAAEEEAPSESPAVPSPVVAPSDKMQRKRATK